MRLSGLLGGTFDPVHCGHLRVAIEVRELLGLDEVVLMPAGAPRLRDAPCAGGALRRDWLERAIRGCEGLRVDARELARSGPTRTVDTLRELRAEDPDRAVALILGTDAFSRLPRWSAWREVVEAAHLVVVRRPGSTLPAAGELAVLLDERRVDDAAALRECAGGRLMVADLPLLDISATRVRQLLADGREARFLVPDDVLDQLLASGAYADARN